MQPHLLLLQKNTVWKAKTLCVLDQLLVVASILLKTDMTVSKIICPGTRPQASYTMI